MLFVLASFFFSKTPFFSRFPAVVLALYLLSCITRPPIVSFQDHEIHRQWVALVDDENPRDSGTQGYLQLSVAIVGPGDKLKVGKGTSSR